MISAKMPAALALQQQRILISLNHDLLQDCFLQGVNREKPMSHVPQAPSTWKFPSALFHDIRDVEDLNINNMVDLVIS